MNDGLGLPQTVLVLGGGSEIAGAIVKALLGGRTSTVVLAGRSGSASLAQAASEARALGASRVETVDFDASAPGSHAAVIDGVWGRFGDIDLVLIAFGLLGDQGACEADPSAAIELTAVNFTGAVSAGLAAARRLRQQGHGTLVALSSVAGERVRRANFVYGATKAGMDGFYQGLGDALVGSGARVLIVRPGFVHSRMTAGLKPAPFATTPKAVADAVVDALGKRQDVVWVPAVLRIVMAVTRHLPRTIFRKLPG